MPYGALEWSKTATMGIFQARDSDMDDAGEGLFAKKSLKQVDLKIIALSNHLLIVTDHDDHQYPGEGLIAKKSLKQVDLNVCRDT